MYLILRAFCVCNKLSDFELVNFHFIEYNLYNRQKYKTESNIEIQFFFSFSSIYNIAKYSPELDI